MSAMRTRKVFNKVASLMLAVVMMVGIFSAVSPQQAEAAAKVKGSFKSTGKSSVTIKDSECKNKSGKQNEYLIKFRAGVTGYITIKITNASKKFYNSMGTITFCNSKKKAIGQSKEPFLTNSSYNLRKEKTYGVKKGQTYYFKVQCEAGAKFSANVKSVKKSTANSKKKAQNMVKKKKVTGVMIAGENKADWYKIKLTKSQILGLSISGKTNGKDGYSGIKITFYDKNGKIYADTNGNKAVDWVSPLYPNGGWQFYRYNMYTGRRIGIEAGTYYVKIERYNKTSSGYYTLKWQ